MSSIFQFADELGPAKVIHIYEPSVSLKAVCVVDNVAAGPSIGGLRMAPDVTVEECVRLARAMTLKNAAAGLQHGGGKSVLYGDPKLLIEEKERLIRAFACAVKDVHDYIVGPDMGTDEQCMAWVKDEIGRSVGLPREVGGIPLDEIGATGWGLFHATRVALEHCNVELSGARVVIQGFGAVGQHVARFLADHGAVLVGANDSRGTIFDPRGLNVARLRALKADGQSVVDNHQGEVLRRDDVIDIECDIWIPAARPDVINANNVERLRTKLIPQGANIPITADAEEYLHNHGVLCIPDFIANAGGVICAAMEYHGAGESAAMSAIEEKIKRNTQEVLARAQQDKAPPRTAAEALATERVKTAMRLRRWSLLSSLSYRYTV